ncbi:hypothetical protein ACMAZE_09460 [Pseudopelagicola sp. nBUS_20]|uniref:hypothetical protein n=1 Tax=Pseudopelagicola sp. nBUS_20 TaxID=3395317 RepID=UPI003EBCDC84
MKIAFYTQHLTERGTAVALFDYATHNRDLVGHETVVLYDENNPVNNPDVVEKFKAVFELIPCRDFANADCHIAREGVDLVHVLKSGKRDDLVSRVVPTMVHSVFAASVRQVHGASYAYISEWLSNLCSGGRVPWVPHMITIGDTDQNMRVEMNIPEDALVFGCYGGQSSFDIDFVRTKVIPKVIETLPQIYFIFMNIEKFIDHPRVVFRPVSVDLDEKTAFINSCDAMLHARRRGETFGLAVGEFSLRGKPVLTYKKSRERAHIEMLGKSAQVYRSATELYDLIASFDRSAPSAAETYQRLFAPQPVMQKFENNLIGPAMRGDRDGARKRLGARRWNPALLVRPKLKKMLNQL